MDLEQIKKRYFEVLKYARDVTISETEEQVKSFYKASEIEKLVFNSINSFENGDTDITAYCDILKDVKSLSDMIQDELCEKFEYAGILAKIGSSEDGLKINQLDEFDNLYLCNLPRTHEFVEQDKEHYSVLDKDAKKYLKPKEVIEKFADCLERVVPEFIDRLKNLTNGGYASPTFSGVRFNGPAITILLKDEQSGQIISIDYTIAFRLPNQENESLWEPVESKITQIQEEIKNKPITRNRFCIVPDVINDEWVVSSAHVEAGIFHDLSQTSPVKKAIRLTKVICKDVSAHNQQVEQECGILFQNPKFTDEIVRMLDSYQDEPDDERRIELNRLMRYGHIFLPKEAEKKYNEIIKSGMSFNSAAVKHAILNECLNMKGCFQDKSDTNMELKLASELFKVFEHVPRDVKQVFLDLPLNSFGVSGVASMKWNRQRWCQIIQEQCSIISKVLDSPIPSRRTSKRESVEGLHPPKRIKSSHQSTESGSGAGGTASGNRESTQPISSAMEKSSGEICQIMARVIDKQGLKDLKNRGCALVYIADHESTAIIKFTKQRSATAMYLDLEIGKSYVFQKVTRLRCRDEGDPHFEVTDKSAKGQTGQINIPSDVEIIKPKDEWYQNKARPLQNALDNETFSSVTGKVVKKGPKKYIWMGDSSTRRYFLIDTENSKPTKVVVFTNDDKDEVQCTEGDVINVKYVSPWQNPEKQTDVCLIAYKYPAITVVKGNCELESLTTDWVPGPDDTHDDNKGDQVKVEFTINGIKKAGVYRGCQDCRKEMKKENCEKCGRNESQLFFYTHMIVSLEPKVEQDHCCVFQSDLESIMPEIPDLEESVECEAQLQDEIAELLPRTGKGVIDKNVLKMLLYN